jgi:Brp/Blh family beta-carotene 15,15'-monooxygenase
MAVDNLIAILGLQNLMALSAVVIIGLPHGAFDGAIASHLGFMKRPYFLTRFLFLYVLIAVSVVVLWLAFPVESLILFLLISVLHFGFGDARAICGWIRWVQVVAHGAVVVVGISQFHKLEVDKIFNYLTGQESTVVWIAIDVASMVFVPVFMIYAWQAFLDQRWRPAFIELNLLLLVFVFFQPLVGFALYFCCIHSMRHFLVLWRSLQIALRRNDFYFQAIAFTFASWILGGVAYWWCIDQMSGETALLRVIFIGLAALTVPHMILVDGFFRRRLEGV